MEQKTEYKIESELHKDGTRIYYDIYENSCTSQSTPRRISNPHIHTYYEIVYCTGGDFQCQVETNEPFLLRENDIMIVYPGTIHSTVVPNQESGCIRIFQHVVKFSPMFLYPMNPVFSDIKHLLLPLKFADSYTILRRETPEHREIHKLLRNIHEEARNKEPGYEIALRAYISLIYTHLIRQLAILEDSKEIPTETGKANSELIHHALIYVEEHYQEPLTMQQVAAECNVNYYHFSRLFQQYTHQGFRDYLINFRINQARKMLLQTNDSITSIAIECGFETISYFIKKFQEATGVTPKNFRKQYFAPTPELPLKPQYLDPTEVKKKNKE